MGDLFGSKSTTKTNEKFDTGPSSFQKPYLSQGFDEASRVYQGQRDTPWYQGDTYAGMTSGQTANLDAMKSFATGVGEAGGRSISSIGSTLADGTAGAARSNLDRYAAEIGSDPTQRYQNTAAQYAANPHLDGIISGATRDIQRNLYERQLPGIDRAASASGNINSSRAGIAAGVAMRGAEDRVADISADIRGQAYNQGLQYARDDRARELDGYRTAAQGYAGFAGQGADLIGQGLSTGLTGYDAASKAYGVQQADQQGELDSQFARWQGQDQRSSDLLQRYMQMVAGNQWGSSGTSSGTSVSRQSGNGMGQLAGIASAAASAYAASDPRLKMDVSEIGYLPSDGLKVYAWRYIWEDEWSPRHIGVMADEVAELRPWALGPVDDFGFLSVNYQALHQRPKG